MRVLLCAALTALSLCGCATVGDTKTAAVSLQVVSDALTEAPDDLRQSAYKGNASAQFSYSLVLRYGLNGVQADADGAANYRRDALASRGTTTSAIYVPAGKHYGHTQIVSVPSYDISGLMANTIDVCVDALATGMSADTITAQCGGRTNFSELAALWAKAKN